MSEQHSLASTLYPDLPSAAPEPSKPSAPATEPSAAEAIYGAEPVDGLAKARDGIDAGKAKPAAETEAVATQGGEASAAPAHLVEQFNTLAREAGLSSDRSEAMMALHQKALNETATKYWNDQGAAWEKQSRAQFGAQLDGMVREVRPLLADQSLTPPAFIQLLEQYRIGSHPVVIDTLSRWAQAMRRR